MRRRFIAFLVLVISTVLVIFGNFRSAYTGIHGGLEFSNGRQYVYRISDSDEEKLVDMKEAADEMARRLKFAGVSYYDVEIEGEDQIRVTFTGTSASDAEHIRTLLSFNATFTLATTDDEQYAEGDEIFEGAKARIEYRNQYPIFVVPVSNTSKVDIIAEHARTLKKDATEGGEENKNEIDYSMLVLWANKQEGDDFQSAMDPNNENYAKIQEKVLMTFSSAEEDLYYNDDHTEICRVVNIDQDENGNISAAAVKKASIEAQRAVNYFNAGSLDYDVDFLYSTPVSASVEQLILYGDNAAINWSSKVLIGTLVGMALIAIILAIYYRLNAIVACVTTAASLLGSLFIFNLFGVEFSIGALVGLLVIGALGLFSNLYYFESLKNELYRGRTVKKANAEAAKRTLLPALDASVLVLLASLITFFVGEPLIKPFAVMAAIGSVMNLLFALLGTKGLMWLLCNDTWMQGKKHLLGVQNDLIPDTQKEEKQKCFGPFANQDFTKKSKRVGIISGIIAIIGIICTVTFTYTIGTFNYGDTYETSTRIQVIVEDDSDINNIDTIAAELTELGFECGDLTTATGVDPDDDEINYNYYVIEVKELPSTDNEEIFGDNSPYLIYDENGELNVNETLEMFLSEHYHATDSTAQISIMTITPTGHQLNVGLVGLAFAAGILLSAIYMTIRYGISKTLSAVGISALSGFLTIALFIILRLTFMDIAALGLLAVMNMSLLTSVFLFAREKEMSRETQEDQKVTTVKAISSAFAPMSTLTLCVAFASISLLAFGPAMYQYVFLMMILGIVISLALNTVLLGPVFSYLRARILKVRQRLASSEKVKERKKKARKHRVEKMEKEKKSSNEPEESIFIGIND